MYNVKTFAFTNAVVAYVIVVAATAEEGRLQRMIPNVSLSAKYILILAIFFDVRK